MKNNFLLGLLSLSFCLPLFAGESDVLVVAMGGYNSCGSRGPTGIGMYAPVNKLMQELKGSWPDREVHYVITCLKSSPPPGGQVELITSRAPGKVYSGNTATVQKEIETISRMRKVTTVFMAGHSYGGWMAMHLASKLAPEVPLKGLYTIDPISPRCGPSQVVFGGQDCHQAPKEFDNQLIHDRVANWQNFYQNQDSWLTSSAIPEARNHHIVYRGPHTNIDSDTRTWKVVHSSVYGEVH